MFEEKYEIEISKSGRGTRFISSHGSPYNVTKNLGSGKKTKHKASDDVTFTNKFPTNNFPTNYSLLHAVSISAKVRKKFKSKLERNLKTENSTRLAGNITDASNEKEEETDNHLSVQVNGFKTRMDENQRREEN